MFAVLPLNCEEEARLDGSFVDVKLLEVELNVVPDERR